MRNDSMAKADLTADRLRELLDYNQETGVFTWRDKRGPRAKHAGVAGCISSDSGYRMIRLDFRLYRAHRLAWLYVFGKWPAEQIDHINGDRADNRLANLREASNRLNCENKRRAQKNSASGVLGVSWNKRNKMWSAKLSHRNSEVFCRYFHDIEDARQAYLDAKRRLHEGCTI
jgi:hypothetical protein